MAKSASEKIGFRYVLLCIGILIVSLILQIVTRYDTAISFAYLAVILLTMLIPTHRYTYIFTVFSSICLIAGFYFSIPTIDPTKFTNFLFTRFSSFTSILVTAFLVIKFKSIQDREVRANERLNALFQYATEGIIISDSDGKIIMANPEAQRQFGYSENELLGNRVDMLVPSKLQQKHAQHRANYYKQPGPRNMGRGMELYAKRKDNSEFPVEISLSNFSIGELQYVVSFVQDITQRKRDQEDIKRGQETAQRYLDIAPLAFVVGDVNGRVKLINRKGCELLGYEENEIVGKSWTNNFVPPEAREKSNESFQNAMKNGSTFIPGYENFVLTKSGERRLISWKAIVVRDESGKMESLLTAGEDITDKKNLEEVSVALEKEKQLNELKTRFVSMASHEFRTPLSTIMSSASLVERYNEPVQQQNRTRHVNRIKTTVRNLTNILNDFLSLDKLETGIVEAKPETFNLDKLCAEIVEEMQSLAKQGQLISYLYAADKREVFMDKNLLRIIVTNLLNNAIKYSPEQSRIDFSIEQMNDQLVMAIRDSGMGIPNEDKPNLFDKFFRAANAINISGTGLGLHIVKRYTELMGGTIDFTSELNKGTTFILRFPIEQAL